MPRQIARVKRLAAARPFTCCLPSHRQRRLLKTLVRPPLESQITSIQRLCCRLFGRTDHVWIVSILWKKSKKYWHAKNTTKMRPERVLLIETAITRAGRPLSAAGLTPSKSTRTSLPTQVAAGAPNWGGIVNTKAYRGDPMNRDMRNPVGRSVTLRRPHHQLQSP